ncbi:MAG: hypothetical protein LBL45_11750 [Treponema sp.]|nr:hypothetical protein [Treponema sp.]
MVVETLSDIYADLLFPFLDVDSNNDLEFINRTLLSWRDTRHISFTRTSPSPIVPHVPS